MLLDIWTEKYSIQWAGVYHLVLSEYPLIKDWELEKISAFIAYEKLNARTTQIICENKVLRDKIKDIERRPCKEFPYIPSSKIVASTYDEKGKYVYSDFLSHTCTVQVAKEIFRENKILSAVKAFRLSPEKLVQSSRNAAGDPADYFQYVMLGWSNTTSGYRLAMERLLEREPTKDELGPLFVPGVSFHFKYDDIIESDGYVFDGYHAAKVKDEISLNKLYLCIIPEDKREVIEPLVPSYLVPKVFYLKYDGDGLSAWSEKVFNVVKNFVRLV